MPKTVNNDIDALTNKQLSKSSRSLLSVFVYMPRNDSQTLLSMFSDL